MKRFMLLCVVLAAPLAGCAPPMMTTPDNEPSSQDMAAWREAVDKPILAQRAAYLEAHPDDPYSRAIAAGVLAVGMTTDDVDAASYTCEVKESSTVGSVQACKNLIDDNYATSKGVKNQSVYYVGFDTGGKVISIQNPIYPR